MGSLTLNGATSGQITINPPAVAGTNTITLPAATGTVLTTAGGQTVSGTTTVATLNATTIQVGGNQAVNGPAFSAYLLANQSISNATYTKVQINTEVFDTNNNFDNTTNYRFTPTVAGYYQIQAAARLNSTTQSTYVWALYKNGANYAELNIVTPSQFDSRTVATIVSMNGSTDYVEFYCYIAASSGQTINSGSNVTWFSGCLLRGI